MLKLTPDLSPQWLDVLPDVRIRLKPAESATMLVGRTAATKALAAGGSDADAEFAFTAACVVWGALAWEGVGDETGAPLDMSEDGLVRLLKQNFTAFDKIDRAYVLPILMRDAEKNASSPSLNGTSAAAKPIARRAPKPAPSAPMTNTAAKRTKARGSGTSSAGATARSGPSRRA